MTEEKRSMIYDDWSYKLSVNLYSLNKERKTINLYGFDPKKKEHLWVFQIARVCTILFDKEISIETDLFTRIKLQYKYRKELLTRLKKCKKQDGAEEKTIDDILNFMLEAIQDQLGDKSFTFEEMLRGKDL